MKPIKKVKINKILIVRNDRFGEFLLNIPAISAIRRNFPQAAITLVVKPSVKELAIRIPGIDFVLTWDSHTRHTLKEKLIFLRELKTNKFDLALMLNPSKEFNVLTFLCGIPLRLGYNRKLGFLLNLRIEDVKNQGLKHEVDYNLDLVRALGIPDTAQEDAKFALEISERDISDRAANRLKTCNNDFIVLHPWASNQEKEWPLAKFRELALELIKNFRKKIVLVGGIEEARRAGDFLNQPDIVNLAGMTSLIDLAAILKKSCLLVTNDSGPMHLACIMKTPVLAIFRKYPLGVSARRWGPIGENNLVIENEVIGNISVSEVLNGAKKILK